MRSDCYYELMSTYTSTTYHIVFGTKNRVPALDKERREDLYRYIWGVFNAHRCHLFRIGGVEDHVHTLSDLHPSVALSDLVKGIKTGSSRWIKRQRVFPHFEHWQEGYGAFTADSDARPGLIQYIKDQESHHARVTFVDELKHFVEKAQLTWYPDYLP